MKYTPPIKVSNSRRSALSPIQIQKPQNIDLGNVVTEIVRLMTEVKTIGSNLKFKEVEIDRKLLELERVVKQVSAMQKGDPGQNAEVDYNHIISRVLSQIEIPEDGKTPIVDYEKIIDGVIEQIPKSEKTKEFKVDYEFIITEIEKKNTKKEVDPMAIIDSIMNLPEGKKIPLRLIDGLEQTISAMRNQLSKGYLHGGGLSTVTHDTTLAGAGTPESPLTVLSAGGTTIFTQEVTAVQSGSDVTIDLTQLTNTFGTLEFVTRQGVILQSGSSAGQYTLSGTTITIHNADASTEWYMVQYATGSTPTVNYLTDKDGNILTDANGVPLTVN